MSVRKRLLLVGAGRWGKIFLRNLQANARARVTGIVTSQSREALPTLSDECTLFADFSKAMETHWDGVILATPPETHAPLLRECLYAHVPTLVEKPLTLDLAEAEELAELAHRMNTPVLVDHVLLFHPGYEWLKLHFSGSLSAVTGIHSEGTNHGPYRKGYSPLWDYGAHDLSLVLDLLGAEPERVEAKASNLGEQEGGLAGTYEAALDFPGGLRTTFRVSNRGPHKSRIFSVDSVGESFRLEDFPMPRLLRNGHEEIHLPPRKPLEGLLEVFCDGLEGRFDSRWGLDLGVKVVRALTACEGSLKKD